MKKRNVYVTKKDFRQFHKFCSKNNLEFKTEIEVFADSIYFKKYGAHMYFAFNVYDLSGLELEIAKNMINAVLKDSKLILKEN